ncbi:MAG TPA: DUF885 domain-containing protein [Streptosporangiaceae bacterium]|nr:DUF885 domain-containing protein [Streptosporangiaceae bacterium]
MPDDVQTPRPPSDPDPAEPRAIREIADRYVLALADLDPILATSLGLRPGEDRLPNLSPAGEEARDALARATIAELDSALSAAAQAGREPAGDERRCARLLRERLEAGLAMSAQGEHLRAVSNILGPTHRVRNSLLDMPAATDDDWAAIGRRMARVPVALAQYRESLEEGVRRGVTAGPRVTSAVAEQLGEWAAAAGGRGWFAEFADAADVPAPLRADLDRAGTAAGQAVCELGHWLGTKYLASTADRPDGVGADRYRTCARRWTGANLDLADAYAWGWSQFLALQAEMASEAGQVLPGATAAQAMAHLDEAGPAIDGVEEIRRWLQDMMDAAISDLDGTHFDLAEPLRTVEARIAPPGSAAAPYYTGPSQDFSRPGRTWLPTLGKTRFPLWGLVSTWYHEGVPGHHLQLAQWRYLSDALSMYQTSVGGVSACSEGWALYAERLMDELGYLSLPGARLGYLDAQNMRAIRVVIDIGMHAGLRVPDDSPLGAGQTWTPDLALEFFCASCGRPREFLASEVIRYLGNPGQAISYKLGERAWLDGRAAARAAHAARGSDFDLKSWHMAALSLGALGLDDLAGELAAL